MNKRWVGVLLVVAIATGVCLAQAGPVLSSDPSGSVDESKTKEIPSDGATVEHGFQQRYPRYKLELGDQFDVSFELSPEFNQTVTVQPDGQIGKPGKYELRGDTTLTQAIAIAGGFEDSAKHSQVLLFRRVNSDWVSAKIINVKEMEKEGNLREDPFLHPGDMVFVPKNRFSKIKPFLPTSSMGTFAKTY